MIGVGHENGAGTSARFDAVKRELATLGRDLSTGCGYSDAHARFGAFLDAIRSDAAAVAVLEGVGTASLTAPASALVVVPAVAPSVPAPVPVAVPVVPERVPMELVSVVSTAAAPDHESVEAWAPDAADAELGGDLERAFWNDDAPRWTLRRPRFSRARLLEGSACIVAVAAAFVHFG